ncbi:MAG: N-acetylmuramic acid 6-phosphate etherase [Planctomycetota bacterium]
MTKPDLERLSTEAQNPRTAELDAMSTAAMLQAMNDEDQLVPQAVRRALPAIARAVDGIVARMRRGGRLIYCGAGTSGRLGVLDAAECEPTFSAAPGQVTGLIAGGPQAFLRAVEGAEDDPDRGARDLAEVLLVPEDAVVGLAASGRTPYVIGALEHARAIGAFTAAIVCNAGSAVAAAAEAPIEVVVGPEILTGSTRLKAGTAQKLVLNMLSTAAFVQLGKVYGNLMVDLQATNAKLVDRAERIVAAAAAVDRAAARAALQRCGGEARTAIVALRRAVDAAAARELLARHRGSVRRALESPA